MTRYMLPALALMMVPATASAQNLVKNGSFENPTVSNPCCSTVPPDSLTFWTVNSGNVNVVKGTYASTNGNLAYDEIQYLDLVGQGGVGSISQSLSTIAGQLYRFSFNYSHNIFGPAIPSATASYSIGGLTGQVTHTGGSTSNLNWLSFAGNFQASGTSTLLTFTNVAGGANEGVLLDNVAVSAVPEAGAWAMMLLGFGAVGFAMRRRNVNAAPQTA